MKHKILLNLAVVVLSSILEISAQQLPTFTQYRVHHSYINPASSGHDFFLYEYDLSTSISYRSQWVNVPNTPTVSFAKADYILPSRKGGINLLLGGHVMDYSTDPIHLSGAYLKLGGLLAGNPYYGGLALGFSIGLQQYRIDVDALQPYHLDDFILAESIPPVNTPDASWGIFYFKQIRSGRFRGNNFYAGISMPQVLGRDLLFKNGNGTFSMKRVYHVFLYGGYAYFFNESSFLEPSVWLKYAPNVPAQVDFNVRYQHHKLGWIGIGHGFSSYFDRVEKLHFEIGYRLTDFVDERQQISIGYGFDYALGKIGASFGLSHEINISFMLDTGGKK